MIDTLDQRRQQVYVEALIVEVSTGLAAEFGVQWNGARNIGNGQTLFGGTNFSTTHRHQHPRRRGRPRARSAPA